MSKKRKESLSKKLAVTLAVLGTLTGVSAPAPANAALVETGKIRFTTGYDAKVIAYDEVTGVAPMENLQLDTFIDYRTGGFIYANGKIAGTAYSGWNYNSPTGERLRLLTPVISETVVNNGVTVTVKGVEVAGQKINRLNDQMSFANHAQTGTAGAGTNNTMLLDDILQVTVNEHAKAINTIVDIMESNKYLSTNDIADATERNTRNSKRKVVGGIVTNEDNKGAGGYKALALGVNTRMDGEAGIGIGSDIVNGDKGVILVGNGGRVAPGGMAGDDAIAIGNATQVSGRSIAIGKGARNSNWGDMIAIGTDARARNGNNAIAIGTKAKTGNGDITAGGADNSIAIGAGAHAVQSSSLAIGTGTVVSGANSGAIGDPNYVGSGGSYVLGNDNIVGPTSNNVFIVGNNVKIGATGVTATTVTDANGDTTITYNYAGQQNVSEAVAIGNNTGVTKAGGVALGAGSKATVDKGVVGLNPNTNQASTTNNTTWKSNFAAVSVGDGTNITRQITGLAAGTNDTDAVNVAQLKAGQTHYFSVNDSGTPGANYANDGAGSDGSIAIGRGASSPYQNAIAIGSSRNHGRDSIAIGYGNYNSLGNNNLMIGSGNASNSNNSGIIGNSSVIHSIGSSSSYIMGNNSGVGASTSDAFIIGNNVKLGGNTTYVNGSFGTGNQYDATGAVAIGSNTAVANKAGVALGMNSNSTVAAGVTGLDPFTGAASTATTATWKSTTAAVAVGDTSNSDQSKWITRQITGLAAGTNDTDAVNVAQLKFSTAHYLSVNDGGTKGTNYDNKGASAGGAVAIGMDSVATATNSIAIGRATKANATDAIVMGRDAIVSAANAIAIGQAAKATKADAVVLGNGSNDTADATKVASATVGGITYGGFAGATPAVGDQVSVGSDTKKR